MAAANYVLSTVMFLLESIIYTSCWASSADIVRLMFIFLRSSLAAGIISFLFKPPDRSKSYLVNNLSTSRSTEKLVGAPLQEFTCLHKNLRTVGKVGPVGSQTVAGLADHRIGLGEVAVDIRNSHEDQQLSVGPVGLPQGRYQVSRRRWVVLTAEDYIDWPAPSNSLIDNINDDIYYCEVILINQRTAPASIKLRMRTFLWNSSEGRSFEDYVNSTQGKPPLAEYLNKRKIPISLNPKEVSLERMFQNQRDCSSSYQVMTIYGGKSCKKNRLVGYKFGQYQDPGQREKPKSRLEVFPKAKNLMSSTFHSSGKPETEQQKTTNYQRNWRKFFQAKNFQKNVGELIINAEAIVWEQKKTASLGDIVYCKSDKLKPSTINKIERLKELKEYHKEKKMNSQKQIEEKPQFEQRQPRLTLNMDRIEMIKAQIKQQMRPVKKARRELLKIESQPKIQQAPDDITVQTEQTITFIDNVQPVKFDFPLFDNFQVKDQIFGQAFSIVQTTNGNAPQLLYDHQGDVRMQIASLTKTMTCLLVLLLTDRFRINRKESEVKVNQKASRLKGTSAGLQYSDYVKLEDLLYGLMLPSGNDAAMALAEWGGKTIRLHCAKRNTSSPTNKQRPIVKGQSIAKRSNVALFIYHMNIIAKALHLKDTRFANVHGLINKKNYSCSGDLVRLCLYAMKREDFKKIVNSQQYKCSIMNKMYAKDREVIWTNTNKLLQINGFCGVKTGITPSAGPCLASCFQVSPYEHIYIVLLKTKSLSHRFEQSKRLLIQIIRILYNKTGKKYYLGILNSLAAEPEPYMLQDFEDRNEVEDQEYIQ